MTNSDGDDTDDLVNQASKMINDGNSGKKVNKIFKTGFQPALDSDEFHSEEEFTTLINRNGNNQPKNPAFKAKNLDITLNSKLTPIAMARDKFQQIQSMDSPSKSPMAKKSKPSSTPKAPIRTRNGVKTRSMTRASLIQEQENDKTIVIQKKDSKIGTLKAKKSNSSTDKESRSSIDSKPPQGTVAKMKERFNAPVPKGSVPTSHSNDKLGSLKSTKAKKFTNSTSKLYGSAQPQSSYSAVQKAFGQKEPIRSSTVEKTKPFTKSRLPTATSSSNMSTKSFATHLSTSNMREGQLGQPGQPGQVSNLSSKPLIERPKNAREKAEEVKLLKQKKQKEKEEQQKQAKIKAEEAKKKKLEEVAAKNKKKQEDVRKRREAAELRRQKEMQEKNNLELE